MKNFQEKSYQQHSEHFKEYSFGGKKEAHAKTWFNDDTVDAWRHQRIYKLLDPILQIDSESKWLTVGDGRYGKDSRYIIDKGCDALATDISDALLLDAKKIGYISNFKKENAEALSFKDSSFDYVFCKEAYHHFPRPMLALYEMLRVSSKGVLLVEPNDTYMITDFSGILFRSLKTALRTLLGRKNNRHAYEQPGNYVYCLSRREIEKTALGLNYKVVAFKGINDAYFSGVEYERISEKGALQKKLKRHINRANFLCKLGVREYGLLAAIIFKKKPQEKLLKQLVYDGYEIVCLPENPYI